jgi:hypothetical protein
MKSICNVLSPIVVYALDLGNWVACGIQKMFGVSRELGDWHWVCLRCPKHVCAFQRFGDLGDGVCLGYLEQNMYVLSSTMAGRKAVI